MLTNCSTSELCWEHHPIHDNAIWRAARGCRAHNVCPWLEHYGSRFNEISVGWREYENTRICAVSYYSGDVTLVWILFLVCHNCEASGYEWTHHILLIYTPYPISPMVSSKLWVVISRYWQGDSGYEMWHTRDDPPSCRNVTRLDNPGTSAQWETRRHSHIPRISSRRDSAVQLGRGEGAEGGELWQWSWRDPTFTWTVNTCCHKMGGHRG